MKRSTQLLWALLYLTLHDGFRAWKGIDHEVMNRLHEKGLIQDPVNKYNSVAFTEDGLKLAETAFGDMFLK